jgi:hypothetical protein
MDVKPIYLQEASVDAITAVIAILNTYDKSLAKKLARLNRRVVEVA